MNTDTASTRSTDPAASGSGGSSPQVKARTARLRCTQATLGSWMSQPISSQRSASRLQVAKRAPGSAAEVQHAPALPAPVVRQQAVDRRPAAGPDLVEVRRVVAHAHPGAQLAGRHRRRFHDRHILDPVPERADLERRTTELLQRLIRFHTVNPPGNEAAVQDFLRELLEARGFECELLSEVEGRPEPGRAAARALGRTHPLSAGARGHGARRSVRVAGRPLGRGAARRARLGPRRRGHEEPGGGRGRGGAGAGRGGLAARGRRAAAGVHLRRGDRRRRTARSGSAASTPSAYAPTSWSTRARAR